MESFTPSVITFYGYAHTVVSVLSLAVGLAALAGGRPFDGRRRATQVFYLLMLMGIATGLTIFHHGGFGIGHGLSLLMLALLVIAYLSGRAGQALWETVAASVLYFLDWFFATTEALTRLPFDKPFAGNPADASLVPVRGALLVLVIVAVWLQYRRAKRAAT